MRFLVGLGVALGLLFWLVPALERRLVYWPVRRALGPLDPSQPSLPLSDVPRQLVHVTTSDGLTLEGWALTDTTTFHTQPWILYFHGNAANITNNVAFAQSLYSLGYNVLLAEYRGFFNNPGIPSEAGVVADALAYYDFLIQKGVAAQHIVLYGFSLGTGVATHLAVQRPAAGLVLEAPYTSILDVGRFRYGKVLPFLNIMSDTMSNAVFRQHLRTVDNIRNIHTTTPVLILHAPDDTVVPYAHGKAVFAAARKAVSCAPKQWHTIPSGQGGHFALRAGLDQDTRQVIEEFLAAAH